MINFQEKTLDGRQGKYYIWNSIVRVECRDSSVVEQLIRNQ